MQFKQSANSTAILVNSWGMGLKICNHSNADRAMDVGTDDLQYTNYSIDHVLMLHKVFDYNCIVYKTLELNNHIFGFWYGSRVELSSYTAQNIRNTFLIISCTPFALRTTSIRQGMEYLSKVCHRDAGPYWLQYVPQLNWLVDHSWYTQETWAWKTCSVAVLDTNQCVWLVQTK